jgi:hypothetical protein
MIRSERYDGVLFSLDRRVHRDFSDLQREPEPVSAESLGAPQDLACASRSPEMERVRAPLERHRPHEANHSEQVVGMKVGEEDVAEGERDPVAHHLTLRALPAVDEERLALAYDGNRRDIPLDGRP